MCDIIINNSQQPFTTIYNNLVYITQDNEKVEVDVEEVDSSPVGNTSPLIL